jgi:CheY-like chemotaxis protein
MIDPRRTSPAAPDNQTLANPVSQAAFLSRVAHELRNPLAPIRMALQLMQVSEGDVATARAARVIVDRQLNQLTQLIDDLADISYLEQGSVRLQREATTLKAVVDRALTLARPQLESRQNALRINVSEPNLVIVADPARLAQAIANVLTNASKFSEAAGSITLSATLDAGDVTVAIEDAGLGIPTAMLTRIFEPFVQVNRNGAGTHDGLGIGLAIVRNVLQAHGGSAWAESDGDNHGTRVVLKFAKGDPAESIRPVSIQASSPDVHKLRILIADDNRDAAQTLAMMLAYEGHDVRTAYDGLEALAVGQLFKPDLILLDIGMPVMDGYQTARQIRERSWGRGVHLVALTGWGQDVDRDHALAQGFQHHIVKPASPEKLAAVIEAALQSVPAERLEA